MNPEYTAKHDMKSIVQGDTIKPRVMQLKENGQVVPLQRVCCQIVSLRGLVVYTYDAQIRTNGDIVFGSVDSSVTSKFPRGVYKYDVKFLLSNGETRTYLAGRLRVTEGVSKC